MSRSTASSILSLFASKVTQISAAVLFTPILVRLIGPSSYGMYATILSIVAVADIAIGSGPNDSIRKFLSEDRPSEWKNAIVGYHFRLVGGLTILFALLFVFAAWSGLVADHLGPAFIPLFFLLPAYITGLQLRELSRRALMGLMLEKYSESLKIAYSISFSVLALVLVYFGLGVAGILTANILVSLVIGLISLRLLSSKVNIHTIITRSEVHIPERQVLFFASGTAAYFACLSSLYHVDVLMLTWWTNNDIVGYYKGALAIAEMLWIVPLSVQMAMLQSTSRHWQEGNLNIISDVSKKVTRGVTLLTVLGAIGLAVLSDSFVPLFLGEDFAPAATPLLYLLPGVVGFAVARPVLAITQASGKMRPLILGTLAAAVINLVANAFLIPRYGMVGAAIGTSLGYGILPLSQGVAARYIGYAPYEGIDVGKISVVALFTGIVIIGIDSLIMSDILSLLIIPMVGFILFLLLVVVTDAVPIEDRREIIKWIEQQLPNREIEQFP